MPPHTRVHLEGFLSERSSNVRNKTIYLRPLFITAAESFPYLSKKKQDLLTIINETKQVNTINSLTHFFSETGKAGLLNEPKEGHPGF